MKQGFALAGLLVAATLFAAFRLAPPPRTADTSLAPEAVKPLESIARSVAKAGRAAELDELLELLRRAGMEVAAHEKLAASCRADAAAAAASAARSKRPAAAVPDAARSLQKLATTLAARIEKCDEPERGELARLIVRLDDANEAAQKALGREKVGGEWLDAKGQARRARRRAIDDAVAKARALDVKIGVGRSEYPLLVQSTRQTPNFARCGDVTLHGVWPVEKLERVLREVVQALAVDNFLVTGRFEVPPLPKKTLVFFDSGSEYAAAVKIAVDKGMVDKRQVTDTSKSYMIYVGDDLLSCEVTESGVAAKTLLQLLWFLEWKGPDRLSMGDVVQDGTLAGITNWTCLNCFGTRIAVYLVEENRDRSRGSDRTASIGAEEQKIRERLLILSQAGICGGRTWMRYLAERHEDPPISATLVDQIGRIQGDELLKATLVVEMLSEDGPLMPFLKKIPKQRPGTTREAVLEEACGVPLATFDAAWREWLLPRRAGLAERLGAGPAAENELLPAERQVVDALNAIRQRAIVGTTPVDLDRATSDACRKHVLYLAKNPEQSGRWPDMHEEYPDKPAFDAAGAWAGTHAVIASGVKDGRDALDSWMATFYHRVPLLEPGLMRIGFALENGTAVLDSGSFVTPRHTLYLNAADRVSNWGIAWPAADATGVPTRFRAEVPQPVPGEDESKMGYPITLQLLKDFSEARPELALVLHAGTAKGAEVATWFSTPTAPTNPKCVPDDCWCLIPKSPLQSGGEYTVTGTIQFKSDASSNGTFAWTFHCGK